MAKLDFGNTVSLNEAADLLVTCGGTNWFHLEGEPGIGKSSILPLITNKLNGEESKNPEWYAAYLDVSQMDLGDLTMPKVLEENGMWITKYAPNARFGIQHGKKLIMMADELTKGSKPVVNMLMPVGLERRLGSDMLPEGSIFFSTGNLSSDGLGDVLGGHGRSRITTVRVRKPVCWKVDEKSNQQVLTEWGVWAADNNIPSVLLAWAQENPSAFATYTDDSQKDNPFIYNPKTQTRGYVCNRSLTKAGFLIHKRTKYSDNAFTCALTGTLGEAAARSMQSFFVLADKLPSTESILKNPKGAAIPDGGAAMCMVSLNLLMAVQRSNMDAIMTYMERMKKDATALFAISIMKTESKRNIASTTKRFTDWASANSFIFG